MVQIIPFLRLCFVLIGMLVFTKVWAMPLVFDKAIESSSTTNGQNGEIKLADSWNKRGQSGRAIYRLDFSIAQQPAETWGLYIPRIGNRFAITLNGTPLSQYGQFGQTEEDYAQQPIYITIGASLLKAGVNHLQFELEGERARYAGLSTMTLGPHHLVEPAYRLRHAAQYTGSIVIVALSLLFFILSLVIGRINRDKIFLLFALASLFCGVRTLYAIVNHVPFDFRIWTMLMDGCYAAYVFCLALFCIEILQLRYKILYVRLTYMFGALCLILVPWHALNQLDPVRQIFLKLMLGFVAAMSLGLLHNLWRKPKDKIALWLGLAALIALSLGAYDNWLVNSANGYSGFALTRFTQVFFLIAMAWVIAEKIQTNERIQTAMRLSLSTELASKKQELDASYAQREKWSKQEAQAIERSRLLTDLHDGLGLQLNVLLSLVEQDKVKNPELKHEIHATLEQFRLLIDGSEYFEGTLQELLGHIRYRIEGMLRRCGINLSWQIDFVDPIALVSPLAAISMQRLIFELASNVIKHAQASQFAIHASFQNSNATGDELFLKLRIADDGKGFSDTPSTTGKGLRSFVQRLDEIGATYQKPLANGTQYDILIPLASLLRH